MKAERSSEDNDGHQVRATIGLAGGCALQRRSVRHRASSDSSAAATRPERWALRPHRSRRDSADYPKASSNRSLGSPRRRVARSMVCSGVNFRALASFTGRHQLGHVVRIDHEFLGRSVMEDLICLDCPLQRDHLGV